MRKPHFRVLAMFLALCLITTFAPLTVNVYALESDSFGQTSMTPPNIFSGMETEVVVRASHNYSQSGAKHLYITIEQREEGGDFTPVLVQYSPFYYFMEASSASLYAEITLPELPVGRYWLRVAEHETSNIESNLVGPKITLVDFYVRDGDVAQIDYLRINGLNSGFMSDIDHDDGTVTMTSPYYTEDMNDFAELSVECGTENGGSVTVNRDTYESGDSFTCDFSQGTVTFTVTSANGSQTKDYEVSVVSAPGDATDLLYIYAVNPYSSDLCGDGIIDEDSGEVYIYAARHLDLQNAEIKFYLSTAAKAYVGSEQIADGNDSHYYYTGDFSEPLTMRVESPSGQISKDYTITIENCKAWFEPITAGPVSFDGLYCDGNIIDADQTLDANGGSALTAKMAYGQNSGRTGGHIHLLGENDTNYMRASGFIETQNESLRHESIDISGIKPGYYDVQFDYDLGEVIFGGITIENDQPYRQPTPQAEASPDTADALRVKWTEDEGFDGLELELVAPDGSLDQPETYGYPADELDGGEAELALDEYFAASGEYKVRVKAKGDDAIAADSYFTEWVSVLYAPGDAQAVATDKAALTWNTIKGANAAQDSVTTNLATLPTSGANGTTISWSSANPAVSDTGTVTRPAHGSGDAAGNLTAIISKGSESDTVVFALTVKEMPASMTDAQAVATDKAALTWDIIKGANAAQDSVTTNLATLLTSGANGTTISWSSANPAVSDTGTVTRPAYGSGDAAGNLTAIISKGSESDTVVFALTVKEMPAATPTVTGLSVSPTSLGSGGGSVTVIVTGTNLSGHSLAAFGSGISETAVTATNQATASITVGIPANNSSSSVSYTLKIKLDGAEVGGQTATVTVSGTGDNGNGGGGGGGGGSTTTTPSTPSTVTGDSVSPQTTTNSATGVTSATVTSIEVTAALENAKSSTPAGETTVVSIDINAPANTQTVEANIPAAAFGAIKNSAETDLTVNMGDVSLTFSDKALSGVTGSGDVKITAGVADASKLTETQKEQIGERPVYDFSVTVGGNAVTEFGGSVSVSVPYVPKEGENTNAIVIYYIAPDGTLKCVQNGVYDVRTGTVSFTTEHFSLYMIGYNLKTFSDTKGHWASDSIAFITARGIMSGTGNGQFTPSGSMTRAMFAQVLANLEGVDLSVYKTSRFSDVQVGAWYAAAVEWAADKGIVSGVGGGRFNPDGEITREQMAVMMANYAKAMNYKLPVTREAIIFSDDAKISGWAKDAVKAMQQAGVINGKGNNQFDPQAGATRAEAGAMLQRFVELITNPNAAQGWSKNDSGQFMLYNSKGALTKGWVTTVTGSKYYMDANGVMVTGKWLLIDGKRYYFCADGKLAANTTIDGFEVGADGARKE